VKFGLTRVGKRTAGVGARVGGGEVVGVERKREFKTVTR